MEQPYAKFAENCTSKFTLKKQIKSISIQIFPFL